MRRDWDICSDLLILYEQFFDEAQKKGIWTFQHSGHGETPYWKDDVLGNFICGRHQHLMWDNCGGGAE